MDWKAENFDRKLSLTRGEEAGILLPCKDLKNKYSNIMEETKKTWGGARKGAGRKPKEHALLNVRLRPETALWVQEYAKNAGISKGAVIDLLVEKMKGPTKKY